MSIVRHIHRLWHERARRWWYDYEWPVVGTAALVIWWSGCVGFWLQAQEAGTESHLLDIVFRSFQLFVLQTDAEYPMPWQLNAARLLAPLAAGYTALQALAAVFAEQMCSLRIRSSRGHTVICGLGRKGRLLVQEFLAHGHRVVVIEQDQENDFLRQCRDAGALIVPGDAASRDVLTRARPQQAATVIAVCGDDGVNAEVAVQMRELAQQSAERRPTCLIHISDPDLYELMRTHEMATPAHNGLRLEFFNVFVRAARSLLNAFPQLTQAADGERLPHLAIVGSGPMGERLAVEAVLRWKPRHELRGERLAITLAGPAAAAHCELWRAKYPDLATVCDLRAADMDLDASEFHRAEFLHAVTAVLVCLDDDNSGISRALQVHNSLHGRQTPVIACLAEEEGLPSLLRTRGGVPGPEEGLHFFGMLNHTCGLDLVPGGTHEVVARLLHEEYVRQREATGETAAENRALVSWDELSPELMESSRLEADAIWLKLRAVRCRLEPLRGRSAGGFEFTPEEVERLAKMEHERWFAERERRGWAYGPVRDNGRRLNPLLVPWERLPKETRERNRETIRRLPALLAQAQFQVCRTARPG